MFSVHILIDSVHILSNGEPFSQGLKIFYYM